MQEDDAVSELTQIFVLDHGMLLSNSVTEHFAMTVSQ